MGSSPSVALSPNADSEAEPGQKCVLSAAIEADFDVLLDAVLDLMKFAVDAKKAYVLKSCDVKEVSLDCFTAKVLLDGRKLDGYSLGKGDGTDRVDSWVRVTADRTARTLISESYVGPNGCWAGSEQDTDANVKFKGQAYFLKDPLRIEYHLQFDEKRIADKSAENALSGVLLAALGELAKSKAAVRPDVESPLQAGTKSVLSDPLDEHASHDSLFDALVAGLKGPVPGSGPGAALPEIQEISDVEFVRYDPNPTGDGKVATKVEHDREKGVLHTSFVTKGGKTSIWYVVHRDPLRLESWFEDPNGERLAGRAHARVVKQQLHVALEKTATWF